MSAIRTPRTAYEDPATPAEMCGDARRADAALVHVTRPRRPESHDASDPDYAAAQKLAAALDLEDE